MPDTTVEQVQPRLLEFLNLSETKYEPPKPISKMFGIFEATTVVLNGSGSVYDIKIMSHRGTNKFKLTDDNEFFKDSSFIEKVKEFGWEIVDTGNYGIMHRFSVKTRPYAAFEN